MACRRDGEREARPWVAGTPGEVDDSGSSASAIILVALVGATATTAAVSLLLSVPRLSLDPYSSILYSRRSGDGGGGREASRTPIYVSVNCAGRSDGSTLRSEPYVYWEDIPGTQRPNRRGEAWEQYYQRMRERNEDQRERVERIRRMQDVFKKERSKCQDYRTWESHNPNYYQRGQRHDWYWDAEAFYTNQRTNFRSMPRETVSYAMSCHYSILGLDRSRSEPYSDAEIKIAFRRKAMEYHPDQNQNNKEVAEAKFKEVMDSYEAIKLERRNGSC